MMRILHLAAVKLGLHEPEKTVQDSRFAPSFVSLHDVRQYVLLTLIRYRKTDKFEEATSAVEQVIEGLVRGVVSIEVQSSVVVFTTEDTCSSYCYSFDVPDWETAVATDK